MGELALQRGDPVARQPPVGLDLGLARAAGADARRRVARGASTGRACARGCTRAAQARPAACPRPCVRARRRCRGSSPCGRSPARRAPARGFAPGAARARRRRPRRSRRRARSRPSARRACRGRGRCSDAAGRGAGRSSPTVATPAVSSSSRSSSSCSSPPSASAAIRYARWRARRLSLGSFGWCGHSVPTLQRRDGTARRRYKRAQTLHGLEQPVVGRGQRDPEEALAARAVGATGRDHDRCLLEHVLAVRGRGLEARRDRRPDVDRALRLA